jgi:hypothetical protein
VTFADFPNVLAAGQTLDDALHRKTQVSTAA